MNIQIRTASFGRGLGWLTDGLGYFTKNPLGWIAAMIVVFIIMIVIGVIPLGSLLLYIVYPVFVGGFMLGCKAHAAGQQFEFQHAFAGFSADYLKRLLLFGVFYAILNLMMLVVIMLLLFVLLGGLDFFQQMQTVQPGDLGQFATELSLIVLIASLLFLPLIMLSWFAPALLVNTDCSPAQAMLLSFKACLYNIPAFTLYGVVIILLGILATIPLGLGFLILMPVMLASVHLAFLDCFTVADSSGPAELAQTIE
ncbi:MAG: BPSS1780 family membrane protein [Gammaproteobacteria bacterium]